MDAQGKVKVLVDEVIRIASPDEGWRDFSEIARIMTTPDDPALQGPVLGSVSYAAN